MRSPWLTAFIRWLPAITLFLFVGFANATGNYLVVRLANGVTVELPRNWAALSNNQRITLDTYVQAKREMAGASDPSSDLNFAANYYDEQGKTAGIFNIRYYPEQTVTQAESRAATTADTKELDDTLRKNVITGTEMSGNKLLTWLGTTKQTINGASAFVTEYRRSSPQGGVFRARLVRFFNGKNSFTITISYREDQDIDLRPICDRVINSIRI